MRHPMTSHGSDSARLRSGTAYTLLAASGFGAVSILTSLADHRQAVVAT